MAERVRLMPGTHCVYELADGLLLVFKPGGHVEPMHAHAHAQHVRVLRGRLRVDVGTRTIHLDPQSAALSLAARQEHATTALEATWLIAETRS